MRTHHQVRPGVVGAFLAGLAVNGAVQNHPAKEKLAFFGRALFIPSFFLVTGFLVNPVCFCSGGLLVFPVVLIYTGAVFWTFRSKVAKDTRGVWG
jgi:Kef-type K+ transport system membrane component KefB